MTTSVTSMEFFDQKYRQNPDPWDFATSDYEQNRYQRVMDAIGNRRFTSAFEPGCSIGVLTKRLGTISERVLAMDISPTAVAQARVLCSSQPHVEIRCGSLPADMPEETFDLIAFVEIGYYFTVEQLHILASHLIDRLSPGGVLLAEHWLGVSPDHIIHGHQVHEVLHGMQCLTHELHVEHHPVGRNATQSDAEQKAFRLDRWTRQ